MNKGLTSGFAGAALGLASIVSVCAQSAEAPRPYFSNVERSAVINPRTHVYSPVLNLSVTNASPGYNYSLESAKVLSNTNVSDPNYDFKWLPVAGVDAKPGNTNYSLTFTVPLNNGPEFYRVKMEQQSP